MKDVGSVVERELRALPPAPRSLDEARDLEERIAARRREKIAAALAREGGALGGAGVPARFRRPLDPTQLAPELAAWADDFPGSCRLSGSGALLCGPTGTGKTAQATTLLALAYRAGALDDSDEWRAPSLLFRHAVDLVESVFDKSEEGRKRFKVAEVVDVLVIDDWGTAYETEWPLSRLDRLVDARWADLRTTIVTTNLAPRVLPAMAPEEASDTFERRYPRAFSRLTAAPGPGVVKIVGADRRAAR